MEAKQTRIGRLLAAVLAVLALVIGYGALTATVTPAHAADPSYGNIDQGATGSIIIHRALTPDRGHGVISVMPLA